MGKSCRVLQFYSEESIAFQQKLLARSGVADTSCFPEGLIDGLRQGKKPNLEAAKAESELVLYTIVEDLLRKTGIAPSEVSQFATSDQRVTCWCPCAISSSCLICKALRPMFQHCVHSRSAGQAQWGRPGKACCRILYQSKHAVGVQQGRLQAGNEKDWHVKAVVL